MTLISPIKLNIADKLEKDKEFRKHFFRVQAQDRIAMNIKKLRKERKKTQADVAKESNMKQSAVSRIEQADYSGWSMNTLFRVADVLDARLRVSFEPMEDVVDWYRKKEEVATIDGNQFANIHIADGTNGTQARKEDSLEAVPAPLGVTRFRDIVYNQIDAPNETYRKVLQYQP